MSLRYRKNRWSRTARRRREIVALQRHVLAYAEPDDERAVGVLRTLEWLLDGAPRPWSAR